MNHAGRDLESPARATMDTIRNAMNRQNMTANEFADAMGVNKATVFGWIGGTVLLAKHHDMRLNAVCGNPPLPPIDEFSGELLKHIRGKYNITGEQLSKWLDVPISSLKSWERGTSRPQPRRVEGMLNKIKHLREGNVPLSEIKTKGERGGKSHERSVHVKTMLSEISLTRSEISERIGVTQSSISAWKYGRWMPNDNAYGKLKALHAEVKSQSREREDGIAPRRYSNSKAMESKKPIESPNSAEIIESLSEALSSIAKCISLLTGAAENGN